MRGDRSDEEMAAESSRRFTKNLLKPGSAAEIRQTACNAVRHSAVTVSTTVRVWGGVLKMVAAIGASSPVGEENDVELAPAWFFCHRRDRKASHLDAE